MTANAEKAPAAQAVISNYAKATDVPVAGYGMFQKAKCCTITGGKCPSDRRRSGDDGYCATRQGEAPDRIVAASQGAEVKRAMFVQEAETLATMGIACCWLNYRSKQPYASRQQQRR